MIFCQRLDQKLYLGQSDQVKSSRNTIVKAREQIRQFIEKHDLQGGGLLGCQFQEVLIFTVFRLECIATPNQWNWIATYNFYSLPFETSPPLPQNIAGEYNVTNTIVKAREQIHQFIEKQDLQGGGSLGCQVQEVLIFTVFPA